MKKAVQEFLEELQLTDSQAIYNLAIFDMLDLFYEWLGRRSWNQKERLRWLSLEMYNRFHPTGV